MIRGGLACLAAILVLTCGCTITGSTGTIQVSSVPDGIPVYLDGVLRGNTPLTLDQVTPGTHTVEFRQPGGSSWSTDVVVPSYGTSSVAWNVPGGVVVSPTPEAVKTLPLPTTPGPQALYITGMRGFQGAGDYLTTITFGLGLARMGKVDMGTTTMALTAGGETISPYWSVYDRRYANENNELEQGELFLIRMSTPHLAPGESFTIIVRHADGVPLVVTRTVPARIGVDVRIP